ncbi:MAG TPA: ABC transporter permease, partial [Trinickia sp.]|nr:ABC transporter permease [Trinickia sp.]
MRPASWRLPRIWPALVPAALLVGACTVGPDFHAPDAPPTQSYTREAQPASTETASGIAGDAQAFVVAPHAPQQWWKRFESERLNQLVDMALQHSPTLDSARAKLVEA